MTWIVYEVWDLESNAPFYVGKGTDVVERELQHIKASKRKLNGPAFLKKLRTMRENGQRYEFRVVFQTDDEAAAFAKESAQIALYGRRDIGTGCLLNHTDGGQGASGWIPTEETRKLWSEQRKGRSTPRAKGYKHKNPRPKGVKHSEEAKANHWSKSPERKAAALEKRRATIAAKGGVKSPARLAADRLHSERMKGAGNPHFGVPGWNAGQPGTGAWVGKKTWISGRKKGPDGKFYTTSEFEKLFKDTDESKS